MPSNYPGALPATPTTHQHVQDDVLAIATELGTDPSGTSYTTVKARLDAITTSLGQRVTGGTTRVSGGAFHFFNDPAVTPVGAVTGDVWVGDTI